MSREDKSAERRKQVLDCRMCGACCVSIYDQPAFCDVTEADMKRMGMPLVRKQVMFASVVDSLAAALLGDQTFVEAAIRTKWKKMWVGPLKGIDVCACVFLRGSVLNRTSCAIYEKRPYTCRNAVKPGTRLCKDIRRLMMEEVER